MHKGATKKKGKFMCKNFKQAPAMVEKNFQWLMERNKYLILTSYETFQLVCKKHGVYNDPSDVRYLHTEYSSIYNHCLECVVEKHPTGLSQDEVGLLVGEDRGNVYQIEARALKKLKKRGTFSPELQKAFEFLFSDHSEDCSQSDFPLDDNDAIYGSSDFTVTEFEESSI